MYIINLFWVSRSNDIMIHHPKFGEICNRLSELFSYKCDPLKLEDKSKTSSAYEPDAFQNSEFSELKKYSLIKYINIFCSKI